MKKMIMAIVPRDQAKLLLDCLVDAGYSATFTESRGGMLRQSQQMLFIVVDAGKVDDVMRIFSGDSKHCSGRRTFGDAEEAVQERGVNDTVVFVWDIDRMETY